MADRFDKFTERARRVLTFASEEAQRINSKSITPELLMLGMLREHEGVAGMVLEHFGLSVDKLREKVLETAVVYPEPTSGEIGLTAEAKKAIENSVAEARAVNHHYIGTEHLLLGLLTLGEDSTACKILTDFGLSLDTTRAEVMRILTENQPETSRKELPKSVVDRIERAYNHSIEAGTSQDFGVSSEEIKRISSFLAQLTTSQFPNKSSDRLIGFVSFWLVASQVERPFIEHVLSEIWFPLIKELFSSGRSDELAVQRLVVSLQKVFA